jgi:hypothetical protein
MNNSLHADKTETHTGARFVCRHSPARLQSVLVDLVSRLRVRRMGIHCGAVVAVSLWEGEGDAL